MTIASSTRKKEAMDESPPPKKRGLFKHSRATLYSTTLVSDMEATLFLRGHSRASVVSQYGWALVSARKGLGEHGRRHGCREK